MQSTVGAAHPHLAAARKILAIGWWLVAAAGTLVVGLEIEDGVGL